MSLLNDTYEIPNISMQARKITPAMGIPEEDEENSISPMKKPRVSTMFKSPFSKDRSPQKTPISRYFGNQILLRETATGPFSKDRSPQKTPISKPFEKNL